jgi:uncharacterized membrane protein YdcZ (DUF606 family)
MPTALEHLRKQSVEILCLSVVPLLPGFVMLLVAFVSGQDPGRLAAWCQAYWWIALVLGGFVSGAAIVLLPRLLRCPLCKHSLGRLGITPMQFFAAEPEVKYCASCGRHFSEPVP